MSVDHASMDILDSRTCLELLRSQAVHLGRVGFTDDDDRPLVLPLNFRLDGDDVVLRTGENQLLAAVRAGRRLAFEVDQVDPSWEDGWSVLLQGKATEINGLGDLERIQRLPLRPWAPGHKSHWLRLSAERISGRRIP